MAWLVQTVVAPLILSLLLFQTLEARAEAEDQVGPGLLEQAEVLQPGEPQVP
jgi:hypothetical protein